MHRQAGRHQRERKENERQEESLYNILSLQYVASDVYFKCSCVSQNVFFSWLAAGSMIISVFSLHEEVFHHKSDEERQGRESPD